MNYVKYILSTYSTKSLGRKELAKNINVTGPGYISVIETMLVELALQTHEVCLLIVELGLQPVLKYCYLVLEK